MDEAILMDAEIHERTVRHVGDGLPVPCPPEVDNILHIVTEFKTATCREVALNRSSSHGYR
jgi:hypothetical protein